MRSHQVVVAISSCSTALIYLQPINLVLSFLCYKAFDVVITTRGISQRIVSFYSEERRPIYFVFFFFLLLFVPPLSSPTSSRGFWSSRPLLEGNWDEVVPKCHFARRASPLFQSPIKKSWKEEEEEEEEGGTMAEEETTNKKKEKREREKKCIKTRFLFPFQMSR